MRTYILLLISTCVTCFVFAQDYYEIGLKKRSLTQYDSSVYYFNLVSTDHTNDSIRAQVFIETGKSYQLAGKYDLALINLNAGLALFTEIKNVNGIALSNIYLAEFNRHLGKLELAENIIRSVVEMNKTSLLSPKTKALLNNRLAAIIAETKTEDNDAIILYSETAIKIAKQHNLREILASSLNELGYLYFNANNNEKCLEYFFDALEIYKELKDSRAQVGVLKNISRHYQIAENYEKGIFYSNQGIDKIGKNNWYLDLKDLLYIKTVCYQFSNNYEEAFKAARQYNEAYIALMDYQHQKNFIELQTKYHVIEKDQQLLLEKEKGKTYEKENSLKKKQIQNYISITILLSIILVLVVVFLYVIRKRNRQLKKSVAQKEILIQEVHHRVKNNLTVLNSLLYIQADEIKDENTKRVLNECQSRVQSMALVHQNLYDVDDASEVNFADFINQLIIQSKEIFGTGKTFDFSIDTSNINFDMSNTIFLGLIINELLTNTLKYALHDEKNLITISVTNELNNYKLKYSDSGSGLPIDFNLKESGGFGFKLIHIMVNQIKGKIEYNRSSNTFTIKFKY